jgi:hypothetical protein
MADFTNILAGLKASIPNTNFTQGQGSTQQGMLDAYRQRLGQRNASAQSVNRIAGLQNAASKMQANKTQADARGLANVQSKVPVQAGNVTALPTTTPAPAGYASQRMTPEQLIQATQSNIGGTQQPKIGNPYVQPTGDNAIIQQRIDSILRDRALRDQNGMPYMDQYSAIQGTSPADISALRDRIIRDYYGMPYQGVLRSLLGR